MDNTPTIRPTRSPLNEHSKAILNPGWKFLQRNGLAIVGRMARSSLDSLSNQIMSDQNDSSSYIVICLILVMFSLTSF